MKMKTAGISLFIYLLLTTNTFAQSPFVIVNEKVKEILAVLGDKNLTGEEGKALRIEKIRILSGRFFDFTKLSQYAMGRNWRALNKEQKEEFIPLFKTMLENAYIDRLLAYQGEKVVVTRENMLSDKKAEVHSMILSNGKQIPIIYKLFKSDYDWKVYDINIEGISMVSNYRTQFNQILSKNKPKELMEILKAKIEKKE